MFNAGIVTSQKKREPTLNLTSRTVYRALSNTGRLVGGVTLRDDGRLRYSSSRWDDIEVNDEWIVGSTIANVGAMYEVRMDVFRGAADIVETNIPQGMWVSIAANSQAQCYLNSGGGVFYLQLRKAGTELVLASAEITVN